MTAGTLYTSLGIAVGNTLEALVGAYIINTWAGGREAFDTPLGVAKFAASCFAPATVISATIGIATLSVAGFAQLVRSEHHLGDVVDGRFRGRAGDHARARVVGDRAAARVAVAGAGAIGAGLSRGHRRRAVCVQPADRAGRHPHAARVL